MADEVVAEDAPPPGGGPVGFQTVFSNPHLDLYADAPLIAVPQFDDIAIADALAASPDVAVPPDVPVLDTDQRAESAIPKEN